MRTKRTNPSLRALQRAIAIVGTEAKLASKLGLGQSGISMMKSRGYITPLRAVQIERATNGAVTREQLIPKFDWSLFDRVPIGESRTEC